MSIIISKWSDISKQVSPGEQDSAYQRYAYRIPLPQTIEDSWIVEDGSKKAQVIMAEDSLGDRCFLPVCLFEYEITD